MEMTVRVSVVVPTFNRPEFLSDALASVLAQDLDGEIEVIVVNDGGSSVESVVAPYRGRRGRVVRLIELEQNLGVSNARNVAMRAASGDYVGFLDDDDLYRPGHLSSAVEALTGGADLVYVATPIVCVRVTGAAASNADAPVQVAYPDDRGLLEVANHIPPTAVVCRSPAAVGATFDTDLSLMEDWDFWLRLIRVHGFRTRFLPEPTVVRHRIPGVASLAGTAEDISTLRGQENLHRALMERWPASSTRVELARRHMLRLYDLARARLAHGLTLDHLFYQRSLFILYQWLGGSDHVDLDEAMEGVLSGRSRAGIHGWRD
jgi:glycosyltransferase involved in cell wall biosynthesis